MIYVQDYVRSVGNLGITDFCRHEVATITIYVEDLRQKCWDVRASEVIC